VNRSRREVGFVPFSTRVQRRHELFWRRRWLTLHPKAICQLTYRSRDDALEKWHCCRLWQRKLANKWNSREFAQKLGCAVPELYWSGWSPTEIPYERLPDRFVIREVSGHSRRAVLVLDRGRNLLDGEPYDPARIAATMRPHLRGWPRRRLLVEEFIPPEPGVSTALPRDYQFYVFGDRIGAISAIERGHRPKSATVLFDEDWNPLPPLRRTAVILEVLPSRPACLDEMRTTAMTIGKAYGSFVRVDVYAGPRGALFGELTGTPAEGRGFTEFADRRLGELWELTYPDAV